MSVRSQSLYTKFDMGFIEVKSKFDAEFRRFSIDGGKYSSFEAFRGLLAQIHLLCQSATDVLGEGATFFVFYVDPKDNDLLPITNTENYRRALHSARPMLRLVVQRQGECEQSYYKRTMVGGHGGQSLLTSMLGGAPKPHKTVIPISNPTEFRQVCLSHKSQRKVYKTMNERLYFLLSTLFVGLCDY